MDSVNTSAAKDDDPGTQHGHDQNLAQPAGSSVASSDDGQELPKEEEKLSPEAMEKALKKARSDAARYRTERNALCESAEKWKEHEDSQKELSPHMRRRVRPNTSHSELNGTTSAYAEKSHRIRYR